MAIFLYPIVIGFFTFCNYMKNGMNASSFILALYFISSLCGVYLHFFNSDYVNIPIYIDGVIHHLICLFLFLFPIIYFGNRLDFVRLFKYDNLKLIAICIILFSFIGILGDIPNYYLVFTQPSLAAARVLNVEGELIEHSSGGILSYIVAIGRIGSLLCVFLFFYFKSFGYSTKLMACLLIASLTTLSSNILAAGRAETFRYIYQVFFCYIIFKPYVGKLSKKIVISISLVIISFLVFVYLITASRFGSSNVLDNIIDYLGQSFPNYSLFYDRFQEPLFWGRKNFSGFFPAEYRISSLDLNDAVHANFYLNVFATFVGAFLLDFGCLGTLLFAMLYCIVFFFLFTSRVHFFVKCFCFIYLSDVTMYGVFYYYLSSSTKLLSLIVLLIMCICLYSNIYSYLKGLFFRR